MNFDYTRAWHELVVPELEKVPKSVIKIVNKVLDLVDGVPQNQDLNIPLTQELKTNIGNIAELESYGGLAGLAKLVHDYGHWKPSRDTLFCHSANVNIGITGATWKFSNLADQILRERLALQPRSRGYNQMGCEHQVHEGVLRATFAGNGNWQWFELGLATPALLAWSRTFVTSAVIRDDVLQKLAQRAAPGPEKWKTLISAMQHGYVEDETKLDKQKRELNIAFKGLAYDVDIRPVRYEVENEAPHPFCIGPRHMSGDSMYLDPNSAPCSTCNKAYSKHKSYDGIWAHVDFDASVEVPAEFKALLLKLKPMLEAEGLEGVALPRLQVPEPLRTELKLRHNKTK